MPSRAWGKGRLGPNGRSRMAPSNSSSAPRSSPGSSPEAALRRERERQRRLLAFLYSHSPAYRPTLELTVGPSSGLQLRTLIRNDRWDYLAGVLSDEVLDTLVPTGTFAELPDLLMKRFGGMGQGLIASPPADEEDDGPFRDVVAALQAMDGADG